MYTSSLASSRSLVRSNKFSCYLMVITIHVNVSCQANVFGKVHSVLKKWIFDLRATNLTRSIINVFSLRKGTAGFFLFQIRFLLPKLTHTDRHMRSYLWSIG